ncbi:MAG TPA: L-threonylcarbamoyladenylate synthase [Steroidobacteraceae bacterium]|nr:L-threonylcarbamoyladenylate synthase [Steroidobacteraceae bacterium]
MVKTVRASQAELEAAVDALRDGELVAFPTETVYGLGANASNPAAVRKVFELKDRPPSHPVIVHLDQAKYLKRWVRELTPEAEKLAATFWPGPLTLVLPRSDTVHDVVTGGQDTVAIRIPSHPMARQLLDAFGGGIAAPSANRYGRLSATRAEHVQDEFGDAVKIVLDGGECQLGLESTIVSCVDGVVRLLRPGAVTLSQLRQAVGEVQIGGDKAVPRVPGSAAAHYAPATALTIVPGGEIDALAESLSEGGQRIAVLAQRLPLKTYQFVTWINAGKRAEAFGHDLYANLRTLDKAGCARILVQEVPGDERWDAIRDRLARASVGAGSDSGSYGALGTGVLP